MSYTSKEHVFLSLVRKWQPTAPITLVDTAAVTDTKETLKRNLLETQRKARELYETRTNTGTTESPGAYC